MADDLLTATLEKHEGVFDIGLIERRLDQPDAGRRAAIDLVLQTGTAAIPEKAILALSDQKQLLQQIERLAHRAGIGERSEVTPLAGTRAAMETQAWELMIKVSVDIGIALVVTQHHVVTRSQFLDEIAFKDQRFSLVGGDRDLDPRDMDDHRRDLDRMAGLAIEILADALAQIARLADIDDLCALVQHAIDASVIGQLATEGAQTFHTFFVVHAGLPSRPAASANTASNIGVVRRRVWVL